jgi:hypothetical protein
VVVVVEVMSSIFLARVRLVYREDQVAVVAYLIVSEEMGLQAKEIMAEVAELLVKVAVAVVLVPSAEMDRRRMVLQPPE